MLTSRIVVMSAQNKVIARQVVAAGNLTELEFLGASNLQVDRLQDHLQDRLQGHLLALAQPRDRLASHFQSLTSTQFTSTLKPIWMLRAVAWWWQPRTTTLVLGDLTIMLGSEMVP
jgi:hypothetical protein